MENQQQIDITERINSFLEEANKFGKDIRTYADHMKRQNKAFEIIESLKFMEGDYVWVLNPQQVHISTLMLNIEKVYIGARAKFDIGPDKADNRMDLKAEDLLEINQTRIVAILYGNPHSSLYHKDDDKKQWWYRTSSYLHDSWCHEDMISTVSKEELITRWRKKYEALRDAYFDNYYKNKERERQRNIENAKRLLEQEGIK